MGSGKKESSQALEMPSNYVHDLEQGKLTLEKQLYGREFVGHLTYIVSFNTFKSRRQLGLFSQYPRKGSWSQERKSKLPKPTS